jgi:ADP-heptose:LPS heptosyltransferase
VTVLALRALGIGDLATAVPALRALRAAFPTRRVVLAAPGWLAPLAELTGAVDRLVPLPGLDAEPETLPTPWIAVNLHGRGPQSHRLLAALRPARLLAFRNPAAGHHDGPPWREDEHEVARWCRLLDWYDIAAYPGDLGLHVPATPPAVAGATVVHPGSASAARRWPARRFAEVARQLHRSGHHVVVTGSPAERRLAQRVATMAGLPRSRILAGRTDVAGLAALVADARLVICGDTGVAHLATGYRTPSVVLFGPESPARWGPQDRDRHAVLWHGVAGLGTITVPEVLAAVARLDRARLSRARTAAVRAAARETA